jgi:hypothetical protein
MVTREAGLDGLRIHDLRHSFANFGAGGGLGLPIVGKRWAMPKPSLPRAMSTSMPTRCAWRRRIARTIAAAMGEKGSRKPGAVVKLRA